MSCERFIVFSMIVLSPTQYVYLQEGNIVACDTVLMPQYTLLGHLEFCDDYQGQMDAHLGTFLDVYYTKTKSYTISLQVTYAVSLSS